MVVPLDYSSIVLYGMVAGLVVLIVFSGLAGSGLGDSGFLGLAYNVMKQFFSYFLYWQS